MGVSLMLRWGKGSLLLTCTGASGAPKTPSSSLRSDLEKLGPEVETEGARHNQWPHFSFLGSVPSDPFGSGPSLKGESVSTPGLKLPDLEIKISGGPKLLPLLRLRRPEPEGDGLLPLLDRPGERPLTTSSLRAEKKPDFFSIHKAMPMNFTH